MPAIIDIHPHIISPDLKRYPRSPLGGKQSDWSATRPVSLEQLIAAMDATGIAKAAIVQASTCYGHDNSYVADAVAAHPKRFTGVFSADVFAPDATIKMRHWMERGLTGMRLFTFGSTMSEQASFDDAKSFPAWTYAADHGLSICMQMSASGIPQLTKMIERFPKVKVLLDHMARPTLDDGPPFAAAASLFGLARYPSVYLKLTKRNFEQAQSGRATVATFFPKLVAEFGAQRLAWGSNYPSSEGTMPEILDVARNALAVLPAEDQDWIFAKTAQVLYPALKD
jgi:L-fuconolactonase